MNKIIEILMKRDNLTKEEAINLINETRKMLYDCNLDTDKAEDIMYSQLGLEMDYIMDIL